MLENQIKVDKSKSDVCEQINRRISVEFRINDRILLKRLNQQDLLSILTKFVYQ